jgi:MFS family permease
MLGVFLQTFANGLVMFAVARAIIGLGLSFEYTAAPMLVTELAHPTHRAQLSTFLNTLYNFGATIAAWICLGTLTIQSDWSWRSVSLIQIFPSLISVALTWWVPESPSKSILICSMTLIPPLLTGSPRMACISRPRSRSARHPSHPPLRR